MMCTIDGQSFDKFTKNSWIGNLGASCHITNNGTELYYVTNINELVHAKVRQDEQKAIVQKQVLIFSC